MMEEENMDENLIPFAKRSKMVSRHGSEKRLTELTSNCSTQCYSGEFWNRLGQQPSAHWMEEYRTSPARMSNYAVERPDSLTDLPSLQIISIPERLVSPSELCRNKKGKQKGQKRDSSHVMSVCCHLEDLRRRQATIDQLKKLHWGGYGAQPPPDCLEEVDSSSSEIYVSKEMQNQESFSHLGKQRASSWNVEQSSFLRNGQLLYPRWSPEVEEAFLVPEEHPVMSYVMATADRHSGAPPGCLTREMLWGSEHQPEE
ncbi:protein INCA1 [Lissotriton helveticus]